MVRLVLQLEKSIEENSARYFEKAKRDKKRLEGAIEALSESKKKLAHAIKKHDLASSAKKVSLPQKKEWFEKFRWFISSEGFLVIGGRDATSNEIVIKKHTDKDDLVFHTDMAGSPFFVIKTEGKKPGNETLTETADATASYSRAWKSGLTTTNVFHVRPEQVSKKARSGEFMAKGAFMIYGKTNYINNRMRLAIGIKDNKVIGGPVGAIKKQTKSYVEIIQGSHKPSDIAKRIRRLIGGGLDDIIRFLPAGGAEIAK